jgi:hypothetical protein
VRRLPQEHHDPPGRAGIALTTRAGQARLDRMSGGSELLAVVPAPGRLAVRRGRRRRGVLYREASDERIEVAMRRPSPAWLLLGPAAVGASAAAGHRALTAIAAVCAAIAPFAYAAHFTLGERRLVLDEGALEVQHGRSARRVALHRLRGLALLGSDQGADLWALLRDEPDLLIFRGPVAEVRHVERLLAGALERDPASQALRLDGDD